MTFQTLRVQLSSRDINISNCWNKNVPKISNYNLRGTFDTASTPLVTAQLTPDKQKDKQI